MPDTSLTISHQEEGDAFRTFLRQEREDLEAIRVKRLYIEITGDVASGVLLSNLVYWHSEDRHGRQRLRVQRDGHSWLARTADELFEECGLTAKQASRCIRQLEDLGAIVTALYKFSGAPTRHFRIVPERFMELVDEARVRRESRRTVDSITPIRQIGFVPKGEMESDQRVKSISPKGQELYTSSTTSSTTTSPQPPEGEQAPLDFEQGTEALKHQQAQTPGKKLPPAPLSARPADPLAEAEQKIFAAGRSFDPESKGIRRNGWTKRDEARLQNLRDRIEAAWKTVNPHRVDGAQLKLIERYVAPEDVPRFAEITTRYLGIQKDQSKYLMSLRKWLGIWQDWQPEVSSKSEIQQDWMNRIPHVSKVVEKS